MRTHTEVSIRHTHTSILTAYRTRGTCENTLLNQKVDRYVDVDGRWMDMRISFQIRPELVSAELVICRGFRVYRRHAEDVFPEDVFPRVSQDPIELMFT